MVFEAISTQWRVGMNGPLGLDYNVLYHKLDRLKLSPDDYGDMETCVQVMEGAVLSMMRKKK